MIVVSSSMWKEKMAIEAICRHMRKSKYWELTCNQKRKKKEKEKKVRESIQNCIGIWWWESSKGK